MHSSFYACLNLLVNMFDSRQRRLQKAYYHRLKRQLYRVDPIEWATDQFKDSLTSFKWSEHPEYKDHVWDGTPDPFYHAFKALSNGKWVGIESATGTGKTWCLPRMIFWYLDVFPNSLVVTTAPKADQLKEILWKEVGDAFSKFKRIRTFAEMQTLKVTVDKRSKPNTISKNLELDNKFGDLGHEAIGFVSSISAGEESATKMQGFHREYMLFVIEEAAGVHPAVLKAIENTCVYPSQNQVIAVGNPDSQTDALHVFCQKKNVEHIVISGYDHPNIVCKRDIIPGAVTLESLELRKDEYGEDSNFFKSRARGISPTESADSLLKKDWIDNCTYGHTKFKKEAYLRVQQLRDEDSFNAVGIDVANSVDGDKACVVTGDGNICNYINEFQCPDASHLAYNMLWEDYKLMEKKYNVYGLPKLANLNVNDNNVGVDAVGVGVSTVNTFNNEGIRCIPLQGGQVDNAIPQDMEGKPLYSYTGLRSQMYFTASIDLQKGNIILDLPDVMIRQLIKELTTIKYKVTPRGIQVEDKEEIKKRLGGKSPNVADSFVYWNWMRHNYYRGDYNLPFV